MKGEEKKEGGSKGENKESLEDNEEEEIDEGGKREG